MSRGIALDEALRMVSAIAEALAHAHAAGVWHCDLKPSNVMIGVDGRIRVVDFGLARTRQSEYIVGGGTPLWMSPEQWDGGALGERVDSWALGLLCGHLLVGGSLEPVTSRGMAIARAEALRDRVRAGSMVPPVVASLVERAIDVDPEARPSAKEWTRGLLSLAHGRALPVDEQGPFPGLIAFDEQRARYYIGREREVDEFIERLRREPLLPIVGTSGAGKSSFVQAGVVPRLRARESWCVIALRPGEDPIGALAWQLLRATEGEGEGVTTDEHGVAALRAELRETPTLLAAKLATLATLTRRHVLLVIDQLEEVFTHGASPADRDVFLAMLLTAVDDEHEPVRVVFTLRDDFVGRVAGLRNLFVMQRMSVDDLRRTVTLPLARCGYAIDEAIVDALITAVTPGADAALPLLQFTCRVLWDSRDTASRRIHANTYEEIGGVAGALALHAERALAALSADERQLARPILLALVGGTTRRSVSRAALLAKLGTSAAPVLDRLLAARLLIQRTQSDATGDHILVEIAHESLLTAWHQLARWVDESREERRLLDDLDQTASLWQRRGRRDEETWSIDELVATRYRAQQL
ncbi:MAG TPA: protein kinase, partial [Kofleriaceae bacterium]|nr:protein kinase [Kofleriaceae bacterium]